MGKRINPERIRKREQCMVMIWNDTASSLPAGYTFGQMLKLCESWFPYLFKTRTVLTFRIIVRITYI